jgi:hypothetical protein
MKHNYTAPQISQQKEEGGMHSKSKKYAFTE